MLSKSTIDDIFSAARVEEVVGEFVALKKRGVNQIGLCPFHDEKTPSFTVSPSKGIYKCFGCGAGGNAVNFLMEHEHYTYPEALKYLAKKYQIEFEEEERTPEMEQQQSERESQYVVMSWAEQYFIKQLQESDEGKAVGQSYFKERGFSPEIIDKFKLGYCPDQYDHCTRTAMDSGYKTEFLVKTGLTKEKNDKRYDSYRGRVIFPIHNLSGRAIGFGGRTLKSDKKIPKYINSPECEIYDKSKSLYGIWFAKQTIVKEDNCYLVEGYTDVISMHQAGVENVVASSGTSLTKEQIRLIKRYTANITILYDSDPAGIKASFRGIDLILEQGMNVKVVLFPEGEDPDSYSRKLGKDEIKEFIRSTAKDFIVFKTDLLLAETQNDPLKKAGLIHEIVASIALIPDHIARSLYLKECSRILDIAETALISEMNKLRRKKLFAKTKQEEEDAGAVQDEIPARQEQAPQPDDSDYQEESVIRLLLHYPGEKIKMGIINEQEEEDEEEISLAEYIIQELKRDQISFENETYNKILEEIESALSGGRAIESKDFIMHEDERIRQVAVSLISVRYELHKWEKRQIYVSHEINNLKRAALCAVYELKQKKVMQLIRENENEMKTAHEAGEDVIPLMKRKQQLNEIKKQLSALKGSVII